MNRIYSAIVLIALVVGAGYLYFTVDQTNSPESQSVRNGVSTDSVASISPKDVPMRTHSSEDKPPIKIIESEEASEPPEMAAERRVQETKAAVLQADINNLMTEFNANRFDTERRGQIKKEIGIKMAEYDRVVLPLAMHAMKERTTAPVE